MSETEAEVAQLGKAMDCCLAFCGQTSIVRRDSEVRIPIFGRTIGHLVGVSLAVVLVGNTIRS